MTDERPIELIAADESVTATEARAVRRLMEDIDAKASEILQLRSRTSQLVMELSNTVAGNAPALSDLLTFEQMTLLLRVLSTVVR